MSPGLGENNTKMADENQQQPKKKKNRRKSYHKQPSKAPQGSPGASIEDTTHGKEHQAAKAQVPPRRSTRSVRKNSPDHGQREQLGVIDREIGGGRGQQGLSAPDGVSRENSNSINLDSKPENRKSQPPQGETLDNLSDMCNNNNLRDNSPMNTPVYSSSIPKPSSPRPSPTEEGENVSLGVNGESEKEGFSLHSDKGTLVSYPPTGNVISLGLSLGDTSFSHTGNVNTELQNVQALSEVSPSILPDNGANGPPSEQTKEGYTVHGPLNPGLNKDNPARSYGGNSVQTATLKLNQNSSSAPTPPQTEGDRGPGVNTFIQGRPPIPSDTGNAPNPVDNPSGTGKAQAPVDDPIPPDACAAILQKLSRMETKLNKLDNLEVLYSKLNGEMVNVQTSMSNVSAQLGNVKADLQKQEKKWAEVTQTMNKRLSSLEQGCQRMEKDWSTCISAVKTGVNHAQTSIDSNSSQILGIANQVETLKDQFKSLENVEKKIISAAEGKFGDMQTAVKNEVTHVVTTSVMNTVRYDQAVMARANNYEFMKGKAFAKRMNLVMVGLPENSIQEDDTQTAADFFKDKLNLPNISIAEVHRMGNLLAGGKPRPLSIRFARFKDRMTVWHKKGDLAQADRQDGEPVVWIQEDLPKQLREDNRVLHKIARTARALPDRYGGIQVRDFQLKINGWWYAMADIWTLPKELTPEMVFTPRSDEAAVFFTKFSPLSNHFRCYFNLDGRTFCCVEQFLAWQKALLAEDRELTEKALQDQEPADYKVILNDLKNKVQLEQWRKKAEEVLPTVIRAKFKQNPVLATFLKDTQQRQIGEASRDKFWGIGFPLEHKDVLNTTLWPTEGNLLGKTLMNIRQELSVQAQTV